MLPGCLANVKLGDQNWALALLCVPSAFELNFSQRIGLYIYYAFFAICFEITKCFIEKADIFVPLLFLAYCIRR